MSESKDPYQPVNCGFHDYFEHYATLKIPVKIVYTEKGSIITEPQAIISDLSGGRAGEYIHIKSAAQVKKIRMDKIISLADITADSINSKQC